MTGPLKQDVLITRKEYVNPVAFSISTLKLMSHGILHYSVVSRFTKNLFSIDYVNIYLFLIFFLIDFPWWKSLGLPHIAYVVIH